MFPGKGFFDFKPFVCLTTSGSYQASTKHHERVCCWGGLEFAKLLPSPSVTDSAFVDVAGSFGILGRREAGL